MSDQPLQPEQLPEKMRQSLLGELEKHKKSNIELSDQELLSVSAGGLTVGAVPQRTRWNILGGISMALGVPMMLREFKKPPT